MYHYDSNHFAKVKPGSFQDSEAWAERRSMARTIDKSDLSRSLQAVLKKVVNLWFYHRYIGRVIYPGVKKLAKACRLCERSIRSALKLFRESGFIVPVAFSKGGAKSTRYTVDLYKIQEVLAPANVRVVPGELTQIMGYEGPENYPGIEYDEDGLPVLTSAQAKPFDFAGDVKEKCRKIIGLLAGKSPVTFRDTPANFADGIIDTLQAGFCPTKEVKEPPIIPGYLCESEVFGHA
jgi:hypothetical protein